MARNRDLSALINTVSADRTSGKFNVDQTTGQVQAVVNSEVGTDYQNTLYNGYLCRAWVKFDSSNGTPTISASGNISSVTDSGVGLHTINFTSNMPDANYATCITNQNSASGTNYYKIIGTNATGAPAVYSTSQVRIGSNYDCNNICVSIFR